jgi:iron complex outermembrane recepter protein
MHGCDPQPYWALAKAIKTMNSFLVVGNFPRHLLVIAFAILGPVQFAEAARHEVRMNAARGEFEPGYLKIQPGDTVKFLLRGKSKTVRAASMLVPDGAFNWNSIPGKSFSVKLRREGSYVYQSDKHAAKGMVGVIQVGKPLNLEQAKQSPGRWSPAARAKLSGLLAKAVENIGLAQASKPQSSPKIVESDTPPAAQVPTQNPEQTQPAVTDNTKAITSNRAPESNSTNLTDRNTTDATPANQPKGSSTGEQELPEMSVRARREMTYKSETASTATKLDVPLKDIPQSIQVVPQQLLRDRGVQRLNEVADTVSGVVRKSVYGGGNSGAVFTARGFSALTLRNGMRLNVQGFGDAYDIGSIESVEVLKGPASVLYGASEPGGTINFVTKKPYASFGGEASLAANSFGTFRTAIDFNTPLTKSNALLFRINAAYEDGDTYREFVERRNTFIAPILQWNITPQTRVIAEYEQVRTRGLFDRGLGRPDSYIGTGIDYRDLPVERFVGEPSLTPTRTKTSQSLLTLEHDFTADWRIKAVYSQSKFDYANQPEIGLDAYDPATGEFSRYFLDYTSQGERTRNLVADVSGSFMLFNMQHKVLVGADRTRNKAFYFAVSGDPPPGPIDIRNPNYTGYDGFTTAFSYSGLQGTNANAFYFQDLVTLSPKWKVLLGARRDKAERFTGALPGAPDDSGVVNRNEFSRVSPRGGLIFQPTNETSLYASYSTSFAPALFISLRDPASFKPEIGEQKELGWKQEWSQGGLSSTLALFQARKKNFAVNDPTNTPDEFFQVQVGEFTSRGVEFDFSGELGRGLRVTGGIGYAKVKVTSSDDPTIPVGALIDNFPQRTANLWLTQQLGQTWSVGVGVFHASSAPTSVPDNGIRVPSYTRFDTTLIYDAKPWRAQLNLNNLTNVKYYAASNTIMPQPSRHAVLSVAYRF